MHKNEAETNKGIYNIIIRLSAIIAFAIAVYAIMTYGQTYIHGDSAISIRFLNAVKAGKNLYPKTWNGVNGEVYTFNTLPISMLFLSIMKNKPLARALSSAVSFTIASGGIIWLSKKRFKNNAWMYMLPVFCVFICSDNARDMNLYQAAYCPQMVALTLVAGLFYGIFLKELKGKKWWVLHSVLLFLMLTGGKRFVAEYVLPLVAALGINLLYVLFIKKNRDIGSVVKEYLIPIGMVILPAALGFALNKYINVTRNMSANGNSRFSISLSPSKIIENTIISIKNIISIFGYRGEGATTFNCIAIIAAVLICVVFPILLLLEIRSMNEDEKQYLLFGYMHNIAMVAAVILCSQTAERYLLSVVYVSIIFSGCYMYRIVNGNVAALKVLVTVALSAATLIYSYDLYKVTDNWKEKLDIQVSVAQQLIEKGVTKVYATYWPGYPLEIYSNNQLKVAGIATAKYGLLKYYWHVDEPAFEETQGKSCLLVTESENDGHNIEGDDRDPIDRMIGLDYEKFTIENAYIFDNDRDIYYTTNLVAYVFDNDEVANTLIDGLHDGVLVPREMDFNNLGTRTNDVIYLTLGAIIHGPYDTIQPGHYSVKINGKNLNVCGTDVRSEQSQGNIACTIVSETDECKEIDLIITEAVEDIQFYLTNGTEDTAEFYSITVDEK